MRGPHAKYETLMESYVATVIITLQLGAFDDLDVSEHCTFNGIFCGGLSFRGNIDEANFLGFPGK